MAETVTPDRGLSVHESAKLLQIPESTLRGAIQRGVCHATRVSKRVRISREELEAFARYRNR